MRTQPTLAIALVAGGLIFAGAAGAANVCKPDAVKMCPDAVAARDMAAIKMCLVKNLDKVSPPCRAEINARMAKASAKPG
jgi:hypothetical protein